LTSKLSAATVTAPPKLTFICTGHNILTYVTQRGSQGDVLKLEMKLRIKHNLLVSK